MEEFKVIYERITFLRSKGIKMKDIAEQANITPSVLSAIYSTVFPAFFKNIEKGLNEEDALNDALTWVNNVSKKKLFGSLSSLKRSLFEIPLIPVKQNENTYNPFLSSLEANIKESVYHIINYSGIYFSYSISSSSHALKIEPYLICPSENGRYVEVGHNNVYGTTHWGIAMMNGNNHLYLMFNENLAPQLALYHICLKLPMYDRPPFLRGLYMCFDYNYNPIAQRILFIKHSESIDRNEFLNLKGQLKKQNQLNDKEKIYYDYTVNPMILSEHAIFHLHK